jgi:hypothetical protein
MSKLSDYQEKEASYQYLKKVVSSPELELAYYRDLEKEIGFKFETPGALKSIRELEAKVALMKLNKDV